MVGWQIKSKSVTTDKDKEKLSVVELPIMHFNKISKDCTEVLTQHCMCDIYNLTIPASDPQYFNSRNFVRRKMFAIASHKSRFYKL